MRRRDKKRQRPKTRAHQPTGHIRPAVADDAPGWVKAGPQKGQRVLSCPHEGGAWHFFAIYDTESDEPPTYQGPAGPVVAHWIRICDRCHHRGGEARAKCTRDLVLDTKPTFDQRPSIVSGPCPRCGCTAEKPCRPGCGPCWDIGCGHCALAFVAFQTEKIGTLTEPAPRGKVWRITGTPTGKDLDIEGSYLDIEDLPPALKDQARSCADEPVVVEVIGAGTPWVAVFNCKLLTTPAPQGEGHDPN